MKRKFRIASLFILVFVLLAFKMSEALLFKVPKNWPPPKYDFSKNPLTSAKILLGRALFYDPLLSLYSKKIKKIKIEQAILNLTQEQLAEKMNVSRQTINAIELNKFDPSTLLALKISQIFNKSVNEIFSLEDGD